MSLHLCRSLYLTINVHVQNYLPPFLLFFISFQASIPLSILFLQLHPTAPYCPQSPITSVSSTLLLLTPLFSLQSIITTHSLLLSSLTTLIISHSYPYPYSHTPTHTHLLLLIFSHTPTHTLTFVSLNMHTRVVSPNSSLVNCITPVQLLIIVTKAFFAQCHLATNTDGSESKSVNGDN